MLTVRPDQLETLGNAQAQAKRQELAERLAADGLEARYDEASRQLSLRDAAGGSATVAFAGSRIALTTGEVRTFALSFDDAQRLQSVTDSAGLVVSFEHDERGRLTAVNRGDHSRYELDLDDDGNAVEVRAPDGAKTQFHREESGPLRAISDPDGGVTSFDYAYGDQPSRITDAAGATTSFKYDDAGNLEEVIEPDGCRQTSDIDPASGALTIRRDGTTLCTLTSDEETGVDHAAFSDDTWTRVTRRNGAVAEVANEIGAIRFTYDAHGNLAAEESDNGIVRYVRNPVGALVAIVTPDGERITFERDRDHRLSGVVDWSGGVSTISYAPSGALESIRHANGILLTREPTPLGLPSRLIVRKTSTTDRIVDVAWTYDLCDRVKSEERPNGRCDFGYDLNGRLVHVAHTTGARDYKLDSVGNRLSDGKYTSTYNDLHQLRSRRDGKTHETYEYDACGNMKEGASPTGTIRCIYNGRGDLIEVRNSRGGVTRYVYDALGRRIRKTLDGRVTTYRWACHQLLSETTEEAGEVTRRDYLPIPEWNLTLAMRERGSTSYLHHGRRQEPLVMTGAGGEVVWRAEYGAFGSTHVSVDLISQPFRLAGQYYDDETGLHYNVRRYYDPELGRFLSRDPLGAAGGGLSPYLFCDGDPLNRMDPTGEFIFLALAAGAAIGAVIGGGIEAYKQHKANPNAPLNWNAIGKQALKGAVVGVVGTGVGLALGAGVSAVAALAASALAVAAIEVGGGAVVGGATAAVEQCLDNKLNDRPVDEGIGPAMAIGAGIGAVTAGLGSIWANRARRAALKARGAMVAKGVPEPKVTDPRLQNIVKDLYKGAKTDKPIGTGSTADAIRHEMATGEKVGGRLHSQKGREYSRAIQKWLEKNPSASPADRAAAQRLLNDLQSALGGN